MSKRGRKTSNERAAIADPPRMLSCIHVLDLRGNVPAQLDELRRKLNSVFADYQHESDGQKIKVYIRRVDDD